MQSSITNRMFWYPRRPSVHLPPFLVAGSVAILQAASHFGPPAVRHLLQDKFQMAEKTTAKNRPCPCCTACLLWFPLAALADEKVFIAPTPSQTVSSRRTRFESEVQYFDTEIDDLVDMLRSTNDMEIHGDILHYMVCTYGMMYRTNIGVVKDLIK